VVIKIKVIIIKQFKNNKMSIYVKNAINIINDDGGWSNDGVNILTGLLEYPNLTLQDLEYIWNNTPLMTNGHKTKISIHPLVTFEWLMNHEEVHWDKVVCNPNVTTETVNKYPDNEWDWWFMHLVNGLTIEFVLEHKNKRWNWEELCVILTFEDYLTLRYANVGLSELELEFCDKCLSSNENITIQDVIDHPEIGWFVKDLLRNPSIQKDLNLDLILSQIGPNPNGTEMFALLLLFFVNEQPVSDELVEKMRLLPPSLGANEWFFKGQKYDEYVFDKLPYIDPNELTSVMMKKWPMDKINEKVVNFYNKCETETANVVVTHLNQGKETNCGIRQIIRKYL
jgi:hypothetical protein